MIALHITLKVLFLLCMMALLHTYVFYPLLLRVFAMGKKNNMIIFTKEELPPISILIAAYNEEEVIAAKIDSIIQSNYPEGKLQVIVGSDNSSDRTNAIVKEYEAKHSWITLFEFKERTGKVMIINKLEQFAKNEILVITDANVLFDTETLAELAKHFKNGTIALVDSNMINKGLKKEGISIQEKTYIRSEVNIKSAEGRLWGTMMGPFGGCYAVRKKYFSPVPANFLVDDFYINMKVLEQGGKCINEPNAKVFEDVSNDLGEEFRRKIRIATGNFQNLATFSHLLGKFNGLSFSFFSHKVLRWLGPLFMIIAFSCAAALTVFPNFYFWMLLSALVLLVLPLADVILKKSGTNVKLLRFTTHFFSMNLALLIGLFKYTNGVKNSIWQPTKRNQ